MRSVFFVFFSIFFHAMCVMALALAPQARLADSGGDKGEAEVEVAVDTSEGESKAEVEKPSKPEPVKKVEKKAAPKKATKVVKAEAPKPKKIQTIDMTKELPPKTEVQSAPEQLDPVISDAEAVAIPKAEETEAETEESVASAQAEDPILVPVKDSPPAGVEAALADEETEAMTAATTEAADPAPVEVEEGSESAVPTETSKGTGGTDAGESINEARSYLDLKQMSGNQPPQYPLAARKEHRQGQVDLMYLVTREGKVTDLQIVKSSGHDDLDHAAVQAISKFRFVPGQEGWATHAVNFSLQGNATTNPSRLRVGAQSE